MNDEKAQLIALLEWLGWSDIKPHGASSIRGQLYGNHPEYGRSSCPRLTLDLMHEVVSKLTVTQKRSFSHELKTVVLFVGADTQNAVRSFSPEGDFHELDEEFACENATKEQRLEALLKTIGKWVE